MNDSLLKLENQLCHRLYMASNGVTRNYRPLLETIGLTYPQYIVMMAMWEHDKLTIAQLLDKTAIDGGAMTLILKKMVAKSLLDIVKDEHDKRKKWVFLTCEGAKLKDDAKAFPERIRCSFKSLTSQDLQQLTQLLDKVLVEL
ncbi:Organic hydroperoxide resistance transcriptional regulator [Pseudoalteromonas holothuriae]|uniref:HTH-type transcriptional regulator SarZ n=1 Tax=Pseudoalteromonas holothuriae TaxID=2963714 RepID=A0A9W4VW94_9GAMM|nr:MULTISPECIES: MarR family transcriptional regulator [unclassified Pseudoalteromonas]CAH9051917.1 Organic hydroperoxide resistance transcriptional regulator [Pseudoalteromonas sp. CIP111854]CAH9057463.1 Organic hydroperoxide resistance transcriptional regulator [Pseudoalteromonas sp. CIP111951]